MSPATTGNDADKQYHSGKTRPTAVRHSTSSAESTPTGPSPDTSLTKICRHPQLTQLTDIGSCIQEKTRKRTPCVTNHRHCPQFQARLPCLQTFAAVFGYVKWFDCVENLLLITSASE